MFISAILALVLVLPAFGGGEGASIMAVNLDRLDPDAVLDSTSLAEIATRTGEIDNTLIPIRGTMISDERMCLIVYDPTHIMFDDHMVLLETETASDDVSFVSVGDYSDGVPVFDLAVVESDGTVRRYKKDTLVDEYLELEEGSTLLAFVTMDVHESEDVTICQVQKPNEQYVKFEPDEERANNLTLIAFFSV